MSICTPRQTVTLVNLQQCHTLHKSPQHESPPSGEGVHQAFEG